MKIISMLTIYYDDNIFDLHYHHSWSFTHIFYFIRFQSSRRASKIKKNKNNNEII